MSGFTSGQRTESVGTNITQICPPKNTDIPVLVRFRVRTGATAQFLYVCSPLGVFETMEFTGSGDTTTRLGKTNPGDQELVKNDLVLVTTQYGSFELLTVDSISGNEVTWQSGPVNDILQRSLAYSYFQPSDIGKVEIPPADPTATQPSIEIPANSVVERTVWLQGGRDTQDEGITTAVRAEGCPMLVLLTNDTNQAYLEYCHFEWIDRSNDSALRIAASTEAASERVQVPEL